jgi:D-apionate oxidoisomerase
MNSPTIVALFGAGGKMGSRIVNHLKGDADYSLRCVQSRRPGSAGPVDPGLTVMPVDKALVDAGIVILALPDRELGQIAGEVVLKVRSGALLIMLDPAVAYAGELPARPDVSYFITHPCHPSVFGADGDPEAQADFFGGIAPMAIVCALLQGPEADYSRGVELARRIFAPVTRAHRLTVEQMALLEPALAETTAGCLIAAMREALDEVVRRGVPLPAARDFLFGHIKVLLGIAFDQVAFPLSDGARLIVQYGSARLLRPDWKQVFEAEELKHQVKLILSSRPSKRTDL